MMVSVTVVVDGAQDAAKALAESDKASEPATMAAPFDEATEPVARAAAVDPVPIMPAPVPVAAMAVPLPAIPVPALFLTTRPLPFTFPRFDVPLVRSHTAKIARRRIAFGNMMCNWRKNEGY